VLSDRAELREMPVRFLPLPPSRAHRTGIGEGLSALAAIIRLRFSWRHARAADVEQDAVAARVANRVL
jgi:hypothetical protein